MVHCALIRRELWTAGKNLQQTTTNSRFSVADSRGLSPTVHN